MSDDWSDLQQRIIKQHDKNPDKTDEEIAADLGCSASYVNETRNEYEQESGGGGIKKVILLLVALFVGYLILTSDGSGAPASLVFEFVHQ